MKRIAFASVVLLCGGCGQAASDQTATPLSIAAEQPAVSGADPNAAPPDQSADQPAPPPMSAPDAESEERTRLELEAREAERRQALRAGQPLRARDAPAPGDEEGIICPGDDRCDQASARVP